MKRKIFLVVRLWSGKYTGKVFLVFGIACKILFPNLKYFPEKLLWGPIVPCVGGGQAQYLVSYIQTA